MPERSRRFEILDERDINRETFVEPWPEAGLSVADSPHDPQPSLRIEGGQVVVEVARFVARTLPGGVRSGHAIGGFLAGIAIMWLTGLLVG